MNSAVQALVDSFITPFLGFVTQVLNLAGGSISG